MSIKGIFDWMNKARARMVLILSVVSLGLAWLFAWCFDEVTVKYSLFLPIFSLLPSFYFWLIRNKDKLQGLQQSRESNEQHNFSSAMQLFTEKENIEANAIGLQLLVKIKNQGLFKQEIDIATHGKNLQGANLQGAHLQGADLRGATLLGADLQGAHLQEAHLQGAHLQGADLEGADLEGANLQGANLYSRDFLGANLQGANFYSRDLLGANLEGANLEGANLQGANLRDADLRGANLRGVNLQKADFSMGAKLQGADLRGVRNWEKAIWYGANLTDIQCSDEETRAGIERLAKEEAGN